MFNFITPDVPQITADEVKKALDEKQHVILLDVRTPAEYSRGKITNSINLPVDDVEEKVESLIPDKSQRVYVYCLSGSRSVYAVETMEKLGYTNVFNITQGLLAWRGKKFPVVS